MKIKTEKGITLIALVVTIIVLLILAAVSIATLIGDNGILSQATRAREETKRAEAEEQVELAVLASYDNSGNIDYVQLSNNLGKIQGLTLNGKKIDKDNKIDALPAEVEVNGYTVKIEENKKIEAKETKEEKEDTSNANHPVLKDGMKAIKFEENGTVTEVAKNKVDGKTWYSYEVTEDNDMLDRRNNKWWKQ